MGTLKSDVTVAQRFQRSIRIDLDINNPSALEGYICPRSSADVLISMARQVEATEQGAFTWTGPYGSGKSSLVIALSALLGEDIEGNRAAKSVFGAKTSKEILKRLSPNDEYWITLPIVGRREAPEQVIGDALISHGVVSGRRLKRPFQSESVLAAIQNIIDDPEAGKLVIFVDEMGKFLEAAAQNTGDIYFFQELAEIASRSQGNFILVGILHQAFEEYAARISRDMRDEWAKIQGRFIDLPLNVAGEEQIELLSKAIQSRHQSDFHKPYCATIAAHIRLNRPAASEHLESILENCWPLHPAVSCLLGPISRKRFGQNQRSIFGFLNSAEPFGFQDFLSFSSNEKELYTPVMLWNYLKINLEPSIMASSDGHKWALSAVAIERAESKGASSRHIELIKTIALLDLFRDTSAIAPTEDILKCIFSNVKAKELKSLLDDLMEWSVILFRKFLGAYSIYAGSDFDIEKALTEASFEIEKVDFKVLQKLVQLPPIMAKRHYHETGALRWFDVDICALSDAKQECQHEIPSGGAMGRFLLAIPTDGEEFESASRLCREAARINDEFDVAVGLCERGWYINDLARELLALQRVKDTSAELGGDEVARKEVHSRFAFVTSQLEKELQQAFNSSTWYVKNFSEKQIDYFGLNQLASTLANKRYSETPRIQNELLNRTKPSSNAVAAQKALLRNMVLHEGEERLKIEGFPPEGGLFISVLQTTGLYKCIDGQWQFVEPEARSQARLLPLWQTAIQHLTENAHRSVSVDEIYQKWRDVPFGVREGLLPVLSVAFILSQRKNLAFYRDGVFQARFKDLEVDYLTSDPSSIQLRWMNLSDLSRRLLSEMAGIVRELQPSAPLTNEEPIDIARALIGIFDNFHPWAHRTLRLSQNAQKIRELFKKANDPNKFLFDDLPALYQQDFKLDERKGLEKLVEQVKDGLHELSHVYPKAMEELKNQLLRELRATDSVHGLKELKERANNIVNLGGDLRLDAFITRIAQFKGQIEEIESVISLAIEKPVRELVDRDLDRAAVEIADLAQKFNRLETFSRVKGRPENRHAMAVMVGRKGIPTPILKEFDVSSTEMDAVKDVISTVDEALKKADTYQKHIILAALAELSTRYMNEQNTELELEEITTPKRKKAQVV